MAEITLLNFILVLLRCHDFATRLVEVEFLTCHHSGGGGGNGSDGGISRPTTKQSIQMYKQQKYSLKMC